MAGNTFGTLFKLTTFGESHGIALGGVIDGCPAGLAIDFDFIQNELDKRKPGQSRITTQRKEADKVEFLSGIFEGKTTGTPIGFTIHNTNEKSKDYDHIKDSFRPSHADYTYESKYGHRDHRGGGRSSARETACRVVGGAIAKLVLKHYNININAYVTQAGKLKLDKPYTAYNIENTYNNPARCPDEKMAQEMFDYIDEIRKEGDTIGGITTCVVKGCPVGLGSPVFDRLEADLAKAMLGINATKGFEIGSGFNGVSLKGSEHNDEFFCHPEPVEGLDKKVGTKTNNSGGVQGGISNGEDIYFNVAFKPVATIMKSQNSIDKNGNTVIVEGKGRHDPCVLPRAIAIVEAMTAMVIIDHLLINKTTTL
ncbi:MAG: chorismate synthase [Flavobacteriales bacterium]|nr:chorismate synthase [Flavobacteriales bacterium]MCB9364612.1 chorismate synthase [Flavobacteriales bacterium]